MTFDSTYNEELDIFEVTMGGPATRADLAAMIRHIAEFTAGHATANALLDHAQLEVSSLTMDEIGSLSTLTAEIGESFKNRKCAHVVAKDIQFGLIRAWEILIEIKGLSNVDNMIFRNRDAALAWLART